MADADDKIIPWIPEDQGEGIKDFFSGYVTRCPKCNSMNIWQMFMAHYGCLDCKHKWGE